MIKTKQCADCGNSFVGFQNAKFCPDCGAGRRRQSAATLRKNGPKRPLGSIDKCAVCGAEYTVKGGLQKYCDGCKADAYLAADKIGGLRYYAANSSQTNPLRNERRRTEEFRAMNSARRRKPPLKKCAWCGKDFPHGGTSRITCSEECKRRYTNRRKNRLG
jgi:hypothetical protein